MCILLEFQSTIDEYMAVRIMVYVGLLYQDLIRTNQLSKDGKLPPVLPIVLYNGDPRWNAATEVRDLIEHMPGSLAKFSPKMKYMLIDEGAYEGAELESIRNFVSVLFQLEKTPSKNISRKLLTLLVHLLKERPRLQRPFAVSGKRTALVNLGKRWPTPTVSVSVNDSRQEYPNPSAMDCRRNAPPKVSG